MIRSTGMKFKNFHKTSSTSWNYATYTSSFNVFVWVFLDPPIGNPCNLKNEKYCLFNVRTDPCENHNRANDETEILDILLEALQTYKPVKPLNQPADPASHPKYWNYTWTNWLDYEPVSFK